MKVRFKVNEIGQLEDRTGRILGKLESLVIDLPEDVIAWGIKGGAVSSPSPTSASPSSPAQDSLLPPEGVGTNQHQSDEEKLWATYQRVIPGGERFTLDDKRKRIIRNALAVRSVEQCCAAIEGLASSPHHNGKNDRRKKYLGIQYALAGKDNESTDERIDKMAEKATPVSGNVSDVLINVPSAGHEMVRDHMNKVAASLLAPDDANLRSRAEGSEIYLSSTFGITPNVVGGQVEWRASPTP